MKKMIFGLYVTTALFFYTSCQNNSVTINPDEIPADSLTVDYVTKQLRQEPKNAGLFSLRARLFFENNQTDDAVKDVIVALQLDSSKHDYYLQLSDYYIAAGASENARNTLLRLISNLPDYAPGYVALAKMYLYVKDYKNAEKYLKEAELRDPNFAQIYFVRGVIMYENKQNSGAVKQFMLSVEKDPDLYESYNFIGLLLSEKKDSMASQYYQTAARLNPLAVEPVYNEAMLWQEIGNYDKAIGLYNKIISDIDSTYPYAYYNQAYIMLNFQNKPADAIKYFQKALTFFPGYVEAVYNIGLCYEDLSNYSEARNNYKKALEMKENYQLAIDALNRLDKFKK